MNIEHFVTELITRYRVNSVIINPIVPCTKRKSSTPAVFKTNMDCFNSVLNQWYNKNDNATSQRILCSQWKQQYPVSPTSHWSIDGINPNNTIMKKFLQGLSFVTMATSKSLLQHQETSWIWKWAIIYFISCFDCCFVPFFIIYFFFFWKWFSSKPYCNQPISWLLPETIFKYNLVTWIIISKPCFLHIIISFPHCLSQRHTFWLIISKPCLSFT